MNENQSTSKHIRIKARTFVESKLESPIIRLLVFLRLTPNTLTMLGLIIACLSAYFPSIGLFLASGLIMIASGAFDLLDGTLARATNRTTQVGALLDSLTDRISELIVLLGIMLFYLNVANSAIEIVFVYTSAAGSIMVSYLRARSESLGIECQVGIMTRPERVLLLGGGLLLGQWISEILLVVLLALTIFGLFTTVQRLMHSSKLLER